jgi:cyclase
MNHDGTRQGYPCDSFARMSEELSIPIIASGGAGSVQDIAEVLTLGKADAALAASIFHFGEITVGELKSELKKLDICVR